MELPSKAIVDLLTYLLPGFIAVMVLYILTPTIRPIPFERVVEALILTLVIQVLMLGWKRILLWAVKFGTVGVWTANIQLVWSVIFAVCLGLGLSYLCNTDILHSRLRQIGLTLQTSYPSEWYSTLARNQGYVVLHLVGQRRLFGWPQEWPSSPDKGHFVIAQAEWLDGDKRIPLDGVDKIVVRAVDIEMVETMKIQTKEVTNGRPQSTDTSTPTTNKSIAAQA